MGPLENPAGEVLTNAGISGSNATNDTHDISKLHKPQVALDPLNSLTKLFDLDQPSSTNAEILLLLNRGFAMIRSRHAYLPASWPTAKAINKLMQKSSGILAYATIVIRFIGSPQGDPVHNLEIILRLATTRRNENPYAELDALYTHILDSVTAESRPVVMNIISKIIYVNEGSPAPSLPFYDKPWSNALNSPGRLARLLFNDEPRELYRHLVDMNSLLEIPSQDQPDSASITIVHGSFSEYLTDPTRSGKYHTTRGDAAAYYVTNLLKHLIVYMAGPPHQSVYLLTPLHIKTSLGARFNRWLDLCKSSPDLKRALEITLDGPNEEYSALLRLIGMERLGLTRQCCLADLLDNQQLNAVRSYIKRVEKHELKGIQATNRHSFKVLLRRESLKFRKNPAQVPSLADVVPVFLSVITGVSMNAGRTA